MALWIFVVFLAALAFAVPITMSMVLGAMTPLFWADPEAPSSS